jgi:hypothetical protein
VTADITRLRNTFMILPNSLYVTAVNPVTPTFVAPSPTPIATLDDSVLDMSTARQYRSPDGVVQIMLPRGWEASPDSERGEYSFSAGSDSGQRISIQLAIGDALTLYEQILGVTKPVETPQQALDAFKDSQVDTSRFAMGDVQRTRIGTLDGYGMRISVSTNSSDPGREIDLRVAELANQQVVFAIVDCSSSLCGRARPTLDQILDSLILRSESLGTLTPTPTLHPLLITATALHDQILALTSTMTPTPIDAFIRDEVFTRFKDIPHGTTKEPDYPVEFPYLGNPNAPITIEQISNYSCPHCQLYYDSIIVNLLPEIRGGAGALRLYPGRFYGDL